ncbi:MULTISPECIES: hypothetical protein [Halobacterium]|uniref:hypothetical protein n=1 Tax=Halobacterium TaxID=2239 RepID=UPI00073F95D5|nr:MULTISPECIES: hypothetical protein [Halobacterium]MCG1002603.1 hypothetical protein [Halobacterium noricense]
MRHTACVVCGGWVVFFATFALLSVFPGTGNFFLPLLGGFVAVLLATPVLHTGIRVRSSGDAGARS